MMRRMDSVRTGVAVVVAWLALPGCVSIEELAPRVSVSMVGAGGGAGDAMLRHGRRLYVTKCAKCHSPERVTDYSASDWRGILADMNEETNLTAGEGEAVRVYVMAVLRSGGITE